MRLLYVVDGRSPIARNWIRHFIHAGHEVHLVSTSPYRELAGTASSTVIPVAFSGAGGTTAGTRRRRWLLRADTIRWRTRIRHWLGPSTVGRAARALRPHIERIGPDLVHAMRIPFEGALAAVTESEAPLLISVWGNDFTLHAEASPSMGSMTRRTMTAASGAHADSERDIRLARQWGLPTSSLTIVLPGNGGVLGDQFYPGEPGTAESKALARILHELPERAPAVVNPRGFRAYIRNDTFFESIPLVLETHPETMFLCPSMDGESAAEDRVHNLGIQDSVTLLPHLTPHDMGVLLRRATVSVSPSTHDGTPNTLLEAMACGVFPVAGDLESIREWIIDGENGLLVDPTRSIELADAVRRALEDGALRERAKAQNLHLVRERAEYSAVMAQAEAFYARLLS